MLGQVLGTIYWEVNKTFQAAEKSSVSKYCHPVGKTNNSVLLIAVSQTLVEKFVDIGIST